MYEHWDVRACGVAIEGFIQDLARGSVAED